MVEKILISTQFFDKDQAGGGVQTLIENNPEYKRTGVRPVILCAKTERNQKKHEKYLHFEVYRYNSIKILKHRYYIPSPRGIFDIIRVISKELPTKVLTHSRFYFTHIIVALLAKSKNIQLIHIEHGSSLVQDGGIITKSFAALYDYTFGRLLIRLADKVEARSYSAKDFAESVLKAKDVEVKIILPVIDWKPREKIPNNRFNILYLGRLEKSKGLFELINSISLLENKNLFHLDIVGFGSAEKDIIKDVEQLGLDKYITFHGKVAKDQIGRYFSKSDIFILPSYTEGLPLALLEAILSNNVCIVTDVGDMGRIINNSNYVIPIKSLSAKAITDKLEFVTKDFEKHKNYFKSLNKQLQSTQIPNHNSINTPHNDTQTS